LSTRAAGAPDDFSRWLEDRRGAVDARLGALLDDHPAAEPRLAEALRHAVLLGGKRLRPTLACAACEALGGPVDAGVTAGAAVELIHAYSLVHDDLPAMDDDVLRRGHPTVHVAFDEATAVLAGDALQTLAFETLAGGAHLAGVPAAARLRMVATLARAAGAAGMVGGQALDMAATGPAGDLDEAALGAVHGAKTGALIAAAVQLGALAAGADDDALAGLDVYGRALGLAFQIVDDVLDATVDTATLGKTAGADAAADKSTYVALLGVDGARSRADEVSRRALEALAPLPDAGRLPDFVAWVRDRGH
jgi:geranylgeranyl pyrophosphate synthase